MSRTLGYQQNDDRKSARGYVPLPGPPSKALLSRLAAEAGRKPLDLYRQFLSDCLTANHAPNAVAALEEDLALRFFGEAGSEPRYCSIDRANDLSYLRLASGVTFVIYQRHSRFKLLRIFDNRVQLSASYGGHQPSPALVFLLQDFGDGLRLHEVPRGEVWFDPCELRDLPLLMAPPDSRAVPVGDCLLSSLAVLLGISLKNRSERWTLQDVLERHDEVWLALGVPFVLVEHVGVKPWRWKQRNANRKENQRFKVFLTVYDRKGGAGVPWDGLRGVCLSFHGYVTLVGDDNLRRLLQERRRDTAARPEQRLKAFPASSQEDLDEAEFLSLTEEPESKRADFRSLTPCECDLCRECTKYQDNLDRCGSQKLYVVDWDLFSYLRILGLDSSVHLEAVNQALRLSVAGMDLETSTVSLGADELPTGSRGFAAPHEKITHRPTQGDAFELSERILLIGHIDNQDAAGSGSEVEIFEAGRCPEGVRSAVHRYVRYVALRQYKMELRKRLLLRPLLEFASRHRKAHVDYLTSKNVGEREAAQSWESSLLGKFERRLDLLCKKYYVYAFNGSGFDFPLLCGHLSTAPWMRRQWSIQRNGSSVTMMSMGGRCIYFRGGRLVFFLFYFLCYNLAGKYFFPLQI